MKFRTVILAAVFGGSVGAIANIPLSWIGPKLVPEENIGTLEYGGTIWSGYANGFPGFGPIKIKTEPLKALTGKPFFRMETRSPNLMAKGAAKPGQFSEIALKGNMSHIAAMDARFAGLKGGFQIDLKEMMFDESCKSATGIFTTDVLSKNGQTLGWAGPNMSGPISCEDGAVKMELTGKDAQQSIKAVVRIIPDGTFRADVDVLTNDPRAGAVLGLYGFQPKNGGYTLLESGKWL